MDADGFVAHVNISDVFIKAKGEDVCTRHWYTNDRVARDDMIGDHITLSTQSQYEMKGTLILYVVVKQRAMIFQLFAGED